MLKLELLSPAGNLKCLRYALAYGADAVYAGLPRYSLRVRNNEFDHENLQIGINETHALGKKFYSVVNILPHNNKLNTFIKHLTPIVEMKPDALIVADPGLIMLIQESFPHMPLHLSVQSNTLNWASVKFWQKNGVERIILSRELSLTEIEEIRNKVPNIELEVFVHGALCMAYSGRCLLSGYLSKRDSNQGACINLCRWKFKIKNAKEDNCGQIVSQVSGENPLTKNPSLGENQVSGKNPSLGENQVSGKNPSSGENQFSGEKPVLGEGSTTNRIFTLEELRSPNEDMPIYEDEHGTYIMNSRDLRAIEHVNKLHEIGVNSLKIEGRTKSYYYVARTAQAYRQAIDDAELGKEFNPQLFHMLESLANRGYTDGFLRRQAHSEYQNYENPNSSSEYQVFVGEFTGERKNGLAEVLVKNKFLLTDSLYFISPTQNFNFNISHMETRRGEKTEVAPGDGHIVYINIDETLNLKYALLSKNLGENK